MKTVIELAREAGFERLFKNNEDWVCFTEDIEALVELARADEREACAKVCETLGVHPALNVYGGGPEWYRHGKECAQEIRARGTK